MSNKLIIGLADKTEELFAKPGFLLIDDGPVADAFLERYSRAKLFDPRVHSFNPFPMPYRRAREFASVIYGDEGRDTLTARNGKRSLTRLLMSAPSLDKLEPGTGDHDKEAMAAVDDLLLSPILRSVFCNVPNFSFRHGKPPSSIVAKVDRGEIGDHDARILGAVLIGQFSGQIVVPDFGFYARDFHASLIRQDRLIAGVYALSELQERLRQLCLLMPKVALQSTADDAQTLARYEGLIPQTVAHHGFVDAATAPRPGLAPTSKMRKAKAVIVRRRAPKHPKPERYAKQVDSWG